MHKKRNYAVPHSNAITAYIGSLLPSTTANLFDEKTSSYSNIHTIHIFFWFPM